MARRRSADFALGGSLLINATGIGLLGHFWNLGKLAWIGRTTSLAGQAYEAAAAKALGSGLYAPTAFGLQSVSQDNGGTPNPFDGAARTRYERAKMMPFGIGTGFELGEVINSCLG